MKIALIGAGLSGVKAASLLAEAGHEVSVFEKSRGLGGRLANRRMDWGSLDIGAQYFTARDPDFRAEVARWVELGVARVWDFTPYRVEAGQLHPSPDNTTRYVGTPLMNQPVKQLGKSVGLINGANNIVHFSATVTRVKKHSHSWQLFCKDGEQFSGFDWLIVSAPAEQSRVLLADYGEVMSEIPKTIHQPCWAQGLLTQGKVAEEIQGIFGDETIRWVSRLSSRPGFASKRGDLWMLHFSPQWSALHGKDTTVDTADAAMIWLQEMLGLSLESIANHRHFWRYANVHQVELQQPFLVDGHQRLALIGAWCAGGRVEGAWLSAVRMVNEVFANH